MFKNDDTIAYVIRVSYSNNAVNLENREYKMSGHSPVGNLEEIGEFLKPYGIKKIIAKDKWGDKIEQEYIVKGN